MAKTSICDYCKEVIKPDWYGSTNDAHCFYEKVSLTSNRTIKVALMVDPDDNGDICKPCAQKAVRKLLKGEQYELQENKLVPIVVTVNGSGGGGSEEQDKSSRPAPIRIVSNESIPPKKRKFWVF